jgi:hypothetical protein
MKSNFILTLFAFTLISAWASFALADKLTVNLSSGSVIVVDAPEQTLDWKSISRSGEMKEVALKLSQIKKIDLTDRPASVQVMRVKKLLSQLDSDDYQVRVQAQNELSQPSVGRRFKDLIKSELANDSLEVRVRAEQVLASFNSSSELDKPEYDQAFLLDGDQVLVGDVGEFVLKCKFRGQEVSIKREYLRRITRIESNPPPANKGPLNVELIHLHKKDFSADAERVIDFEVSEQGDELETSIDVSRAYEGRGVIFEAEEKNYIGVSGFPLVYSGLPVGGNSVCPFEQGRGFTRKFRGVIRISFCEPGRPDSPAGVLNFGLFAARIDNPRDIIMEAYNADSQLLGCVEATQGPITFFGIKSNEPIAFVRILSNPYLFNLSRHVDETFVVDHIWYGEPVGLRSAKLARASEEMSTVVLKSGDILSVEDIRFTEDGIQVFEPQLKRRMTFPQNEVGSVCLSERPIGRRVANTTSQLRVPEPTSDKWAVMLKDRSVLTVTPDADFQAELFRGAKLEQESIVGLWALRDQVRFPVAGDFDKGEHVLVFPTCRVATKVELNDKGASWDEDAEKIEQPIFEGIPSEDATPQFNQFEFGRRTESQMPTIWFQKPVLADPAWGAIELLDGQRLTLGSNGGFEIESINDQFVVVEGPGDLKANLPMTQVRAIKFPNKN